MVSLLTAFLSLIWRFFLFYFQSSHQQQLNTKYGSHPATVDIDILTYNFFLQIKLLLLSQLVLLVQQVQVHYDFFYFNDAGSGHAVPAHHHRRWNERSLYGRVLFIALSCAQDEITPHHTHAHTHSVISTAYHLLSAVTGKCTLRVHLHVTHSFTAVWYAFLFAPQFAPLASFCVNS